MWGEGGWQWISNGSQPKGNTDAFSLYFLSFWITHRQITNTNIHNLLILLKTMMNCLLLLLLFTDRLMA